VLSLCMGLGWCGFWGFGGVLGGGDCVGTVFWTSGERGGEGGGMEWYGMEESHGRVEWDCMGTWLCLSLVLRVV